MKLFNKTEVKKLPEPELKRIPIEKLKFAPYQRKLNQTKVRKIIENFEPDVVQIALVSYRDGEFYVIDAQHRIKALEQLGYTEILCQVITGLTYAEECRRFNILNTGRTQLTANQVFHCRVEEREMSALLLVDMFKKYKFSYNKDNATKKDNVIGAVSKFVRMEKNYGLDMVENVLRILRNSWFGDEKSLSSAIISGIATFLNEEPDADEDLLVDVLSHISPEELIASATAFMKFGVLRLGRADGTCYHIAKQIGELYDAGLKRANKGAKCACVTG